jgi:hypothetical protein
VNLPGYSLGRKARAATDPTTGKAISTKNEIILNHKGGKASFVIVGTSRRSALTKRESVVKYNEAGRKKSE